MTLILTQINKHGIVFATDSNITIGNKGTESGQKIFEIPNLKAALCIAGSYLVNKEDMSKWMSNHIKKDRSKTLKQFTENLCKTLEKEMLLNEKENGCIMHICGFVKDDSSYHPEMWHISNVILTDGEYKNSEFHSSEDFWRRDWQKSKEAIKDSKGYQYYINGFSPGRISFNIAGQYLHEFLYQVFWNNSDKNFKEFRPPQNLDENEHLMKLFMQFIAAMFELSNYSPKLIGGKIQSYKIKSPDPLWSSQ